MISFKNFLKESNTRMHEAKGDKIKPGNLKELKQIVRNTISEKGYDCDLNFLDVSEITDMTGLFRGSNFNGDISKWEPFSVEDMSGMFRNSKFNSDISKWDVSTVKDMSGMFMGSKFSKDISKWDVSDVESHRKMFDNCPLENKPEYQPKL